MIAPRSTPQDPGRTSPAAGDPSPAALAARGAWAVAWRIALFVAIWGVLLAPGLVPLARRLERSGGMDSPWARLRLEALAAVAILLAGWIMMRFIDRCPFSALGFAGRRAGRDLLAGGALGSALVLASVALAWLGGWAEPREIAGFSGSALALLAAALLLNTVTQEVLMRGYILGALRARGGARVAVGLSSALFVLAHAGAPGGALLPAINIFAAGILLGVACVASGGLWLPIGIHFGWNFVQGPLLGLTVSGRSLGAGWEVVRLGGPPILTGGAFGLEGGVIATLTTALGVAVVGVAAGRLRGQGVGPGEGRGREGRRGTGGAPAGSEKEEGSVERKEERSEEADVRKSDEEWRRLLTPEQYEICRRRGTEPPFTGKYWDCKEPGVYRCACCGSELFKSDAKFDSRTGWPSFTRALDPERVALSEDLSHGMRRIEASCRRCGAHLGHLFDDGPAPTGQRYCINSAALDLERRK